MYLATASAVAVVFLAAAFTLHFSKSAKKTVSWLMLLGGFGVAGVFGALLARGAGLLVGTTGSATRSIFGAGVPFAAVLIVAILLGIHMKPKGKGPNRATPWLALSFGSLLAALGGGFAQMVGTVPDEVYAAVTNFFASLG